MHKIFLASFAVNVFSLRKNELASITTQTIFTGFYERLRAVREYHSKYPELAATDSNILETPAERMSWKHILYINELLIILIIV